jgi:hypothetical protein
MVHGRRLFGSIEQRSGYFRVRYVADTNFGGPVRALASSTCPQAATPSRTWRWVSGRLRNWGMAVGSGWSIHTRNVALIDNRVGFGCGAFDSIADQTRFQGNSETGFALSADAGGTITRSVFAANAVNLDGPRCAFYADP